MKITLVSRGDASSGGAGCVAEQLSVGLRHRGYQVTHIVRRKVNRACRFQSLCLPELKSLRIREAYSFCDYSINEENL